MKKKNVFSLTIMLAGLVQEVAAQCSICTKTAQQLGEGPAHSLNAGILYLMFMPLAIMGYVGYKWWKNEKEMMKNKGQGS